MPRISLCQVYPLCTYLSHYYYYYYYYPPCTYTHNGRQANQKTTSSCDWTRLAA